MAPSMAPAMAPKISTMAPEIAPELALETWRNGDADNGAWIRRDGTSNGAWTGADNGACKTARCGSGNGARKFNFFFFFINKFYYFLEC